MQAEQSLKLGKINETPPSMRNHIQDQRLREQSREGHGLNSHSQLLQFGC